MASESQSEQLKAISSWAGDLACPACHQALQVKDTTIVCTGCERIYPILDGIPVLIAERGSLPESSRKDAF
jgi:uncharacterized protein YbaR (Trm112 family)